MKRNRIIAIGGTTASGKSQIAIDLANKYGGIIINADSRQIYKDLNIGTAKPIPESISQNGIWYIKGIEHHLFGFANLDTKYNIYSFQNDVKNILSNYSDTNIFFTGGTGLYIDSIIHGYILPQTEENHISETLDVKELQKKLGSRINELNQSDRQNPRRLLSLLRNINPPSAENLDNYLYLVLDVEKDELNRRIEKRVDEMFENGLIEENVQIHKSYPDYDIPSLNTIGYSEFKEYFDGTKKIEEIKELIKTHTRQYAKRQRTWFKRNSESIHISNIEQADQAVGNFLRTI